MRSIKKFFLLLCITLFSQITPAFSMTAEYLEAFGNTPRSPTEIHYFLQALFPIKLQICIIDVNPKKVEDSLKTKFYNEPGAYAPEEYSATYADIWEEYIEKPLKLCISLGNPKIKAALQGWVNGYIGDQCIVSALKYFLQDYREIAPQADQIISWLRYKIDQTYS